MWHNCFIVDFILYSYTQGKTLKQTWQERLRKHLTSSKMLSSLISLLYFYSKKEIEQNSIKMLLWSFTCLIHKQTNTFFIRWWLCFVFWKVHQSLRLPSHNAQKWSNCSVNFHFQSQALFISFYLFCILFTVLWTL